MIVKIVQKHLEAGLAVVCVIAQLGLKHGVRARRDVVAAFFVAQLFAVKKLVKLLQGFGSHFWRHDLNILLKRNDITIMRKRIEK